MKLHLQEMAQRQRRKVVVSENVSDTGDSRPRSILKPTPSTDVATSLSRPAFIQGAIPRRTQIWQILLS